MFLLVVAPTRGLASKGVAMATSRKACIPEVGSVARILAGWQCCTRTLADAMVARGQMMMPTSVGSGAGQTAEITAVMNGGLHVSRYPLTTSSNIKPPLDVHEAHTNRTTVMMKSCGCWQLQVHAKLNNRHTPHTANAVSNSVPTTPTSHSPRENTPASAAQQPPTDPTAFTRSLAPTAVITLSP